MTPFRLPGDDVVFQSLNALAIPWLDAVMVFASSREFAVLASVMLVAWLWGSLRRHALRPVIQASVSLGIVDWLGHEVLKPWVGRTRPCFELPKGSFRCLVEIGNSGSMPSLHAANAFAVAMAVSLAWPYAGRVLFPIAALVAISRVFVGVHWPSDVVAGALYGCLVALLVHSAWTLAQSRRVRKMAAPVQE